MVKIVQESELWRDFLPGGAKIMTKQSGFVSLENDEVKSLRKKNWRVLIE